MSDEIPSASMADIAFLLLIFFLVTTVFPKDKGLAIVLPEDQAEEVEVSQRNILHLIIMPDGLVTVRRGESEAEQRVPPAQVENIWRLDVADNPNLIAAVKTHPDTAYRYMIDVLDALQVAGAERISLQLLD